MDQLVSSVKAKVIKKLQSPETAVQLEALNAIYTEGTSTRRHVRELLGQNVVPLLTNLIYTKNQMIKHAALGALHQISQFGLREREVVIRQYSINGGLRLINSQSRAPEHSTLHWLTPLRDPSIAQWNNSVLKSLVRALPLMSGVGYTPRVHSVIGVCIAFYYFSSKEMPVRIDVLIELRLLRRILKLLLFKEPSVVMLGLETVTTIAGCSPHYAEVVCEAGVLAILPYLLRHECILVSNSTLALLLKIIATCPIQVLRRMLVRPIISPLLEKLEENDENVRKEAAHILTIFIKYGEEEEVWHLVIIFNVMKRYFSILHINDVETVRHVVEGMSFILRYSVARGLTKRTLYCIESTNGVPRLTDIAGHKNDHISYMACNILREHFPN